MVLAIEQAAKYAAVLGAVIFATESIALIANPWIYVILAKEPLAGSRLVGRCIMLLGRECFATNATHDFLF